MATHPFLSKLKAAHTQSNNWLCVGLDPDMDRLPDRFDKSISGMESFLKQVVDETSDHCVAFKPNISFFEGLGMDGLALLKRLIAYIPNRVPVILDAKRGDIGNTSRMQAVFIYDELGADATTLHPYMGRDSVEPFFSYKDTFNFVLGLTSNPGSANFQQLEMKNGRDLYQNVMATCSEWNREFGNVGVVVGGTQEKLADARKVDDDLLFLIPGVGAQGGKYDDVVEKGKNREGLTLINASRSILYGQSNYRTNIAELIT